MSKELLEGPPDMEKGLEEKSYNNYRKLGGIINEADYNSAFKRLENAKSLDGPTRLQAENIASFSGIELSDKEDSLDKRVLLYGILRSDIRPGGVKYHHDQMSDQQIFMEALRMCGDVESVNKVIHKHPHINFKYQEGSSK